MTAPHTHDEVTLGVEEEYLLLDRGTALPAPRAAEVQAAARQQTALGRDEVDVELLQAQVEVATPICTDLDGVASQLARLRAAVAVAADRAGCRLAATGAAPVADGQAMPVTQKPRYRAMHADAAQLVDEQVINGMHIHVAVPSRTAGAAALGRLRPWLPLLVALGANSPYWEGRDTGFGSWRTVVFGRWPVSGSPPFVTGEKEYAERVDALLATGVIRDRHQLYWHARLSEDYPTLEIRAPDVQLDIDSAVTLAGIARGLVTTALREEREGVTPLDPPGSIVYAAGWHAARHGLSRDLVDPRHGTPAPAEEVAGALLDHIAQALDGLGDRERVDSGVRRLLERGTGAVRQRQAVEEGGLDALLDLISVPVTADPAGPAARPGLVSRDSGEGGSRMGPRQYDPPPAQGSGSPAQAPADPGTAETAQAPGGSGDLQRPGEPGSHGEPGTSGDPGDLGSPADGGRPEGPVGAGGPGSPGELTAPGGPGKSPEGG